MDESYDPILPKATKPEPPPLRRLWKNPEEEAAEDLPTAKKKREPLESRAAASPEKPKKKKKVEDVVDDGTGATKLEETPVLDTYEARQRARWLIGGLGSAIGVTALIIIVQAFRGSGTEEIREGEPPDPRVAIEPRANFENEARVMLDTAKQSDKLGKTKVAVDLLQKLTKTYQNTAAAREAMHAIDRNRHNLPLFGADVPEQVSGPKPPSTPNPPLAIGPSPNPNAAPNANSADTSKPPVPKAAPPVVTPPVAPTPEIKPLPSGYRPKFDAPIHTSGWPTRILCDRDGAEMILVPGDRFLMGREDGEPSERPVHQVAVSTYYIDLHEVTVGQYRTFLKETGRPIDMAKLAPPPATDDHPIGNVSAREAKEFCTWAGRRLPTEAQWEMAARSPTGRISFWNGELPRKDPAKGPRRTEPVMSLPSDLSPYGAFDMGANAWEWTSEYYDSHYYKQFRNLATDPTGPKESPAKIALFTVKGGSKSGILTWREGLNSATRLPYVGFRGALPVEGAPVAPATAPTPSTNPSLPGGVQPF